MVFRYFLKALSVIISNFVRFPAPNLVVLMYHRVTGDVPLELDLPFSIFEKQMQLLAKDKQVVSMDEAIRRIKGNEIIGQTLFVITFDDAYKDFYTHAFPLLNNLGLPVTLYVSTGFLNSPTKPPISRKVVNSESLQPITWEMLKEISASPLVTIGGHTHSHFELTSLTDEVIHEELNQCDSMLEKVIGQNVHHFSYPRGIWNNRVQRLVMKRYTTITLAGGGCVFATDFIPYHIPRVPVLRSDGLLWFEARITGKLIFEEHMVRFLKMVAGKFENFVFLFHHGRK